MSRKKSTDDSLDLLLDTICNTFGGIVFISILVVILVNSASESAGNSAPTEEMRQQLRADRRRLNSTSEKLSQLRRAVRQATALQEKFGDAEAKVILADLATLQSSTNQVHEQRDESLDSLAAEQEEINEAASQLQKLKQIMRQTQSTLDAARQQLKNEIALRSRTSELPRQRRSSRKGVPIFLIKGRMCRHAQVSGGNLVLSGTESRIESSGTVNYAVPIPSAGLAITEQSSEQINARLLDYDPAKHVLQVIVWEDSFKQFETFKDVAIRMGFKYELTPFPSTEQRVPIGTREINEQ